MGFRILADLTVLAHLAFVVFAVGGGLLALRWPRIVWLHLPAAAWAVFVELSGRVCPLTPLENWLRVRGGGAAYASGFIEQYVLPVLYPASLSRELQWALAGVVVVANAGVYAYVLRRRIPRSGRSDPATQLRSEPEGRASRWAPFLAAFCAATVVYLVARDLFVPHVRDVEVWFGLEVRGWAARASAPLHWAIFALGAWAFATRRAWIWPAATGYAVYVALSHLVWNLTSPSGGGFVAGLVQLGLFLAPAVFLFWLRPTRTRPTAARPGGRI